MRSSETVNGRCGDGVCVDQVFVVARRVGRIRNLGHRIGVEKWAATARGAIVAGQRSLGDVQ